MSRRKIADFSVLLSAYTGRMKFKLGYVKSCNMASRQVLVIANSNKAYSLTIELLS